MSSQKQPNDYPKFTDVPPVSGMPQGCAWGVFNKGGERDNLGTLNYLTPEVVLRARDEIQKGTSISLNLPLHHPTHPSASRPVLSHTISSLFPHGYPAYDDHVSFNTQSSSQWDGLKHYAHSPTNKLYNNLSYADAPHTTDNGIQHWHSRGGIIGRGILIDYRAYAERHGMAYSPTEPHGITVDTIQKVAAEQGTQFLPGDILIVRTGLVAWYHSATTEQREAVLQRGDALSCAGVVGSLETLEWLWNGRFAAVAGDSMGWEVVPPRKVEYMLHEWLIALWGMPIGEWWDLEELSRVCEREGRWSFFLASVPLNVEGGVASPPNAVVIL
ncbi:hypothetical protein EV356DRAFT_452566 [Viridothelium virens]|uniref:Cyclase n=1 Tax=Viridothelium virens TaxID=1048519 RepID=A0A6A6H002_VIRVR|nr:hypothetical protein EV356DRAFT_452566 [Viridothelium virens]